MVTVIVFYKNYSGISTDYLDVECDVNITGKVAQIDNAASSVAVTITDVSVTKGTEINSYEKILCYFKSEKSERASEKLSEKSII